MAILAIDGNFFSQRIRAALGLTFINNPEHDEQVLLYECTRTLCSELTRIPCITKVYIGRDRGSWRKQLTPVYPEPVNGIHWKDDDAQTYKKNREKEETSFDAKAFYEAYNKWLELISTKLRIPVIATPGAEADDILAYIAHTMSNDDFVVLWSSDGDYIQLIQNNVALLKFPKRQLWIDDSYIKKSNDIFSLNSHSTYHTICESFKRPDIVFENPFHSIFKKIIYGDSKDNVPPVMFWLNKKEQKRRPSDSYIEKAFDLLGVDPDSLTVDFLYQPDSIKMFLQHLVTVTKTNCNLEHLYNVYKSNLELKRLDLHQIPATIQQQIEPAIKYSRQPEDLSYISKFENATKMLELIEPEEQTQTFMQTFDTNADLTFSDTLQTFFS